MIDTTKIITSTLEVFKHTKYNLLPSIGEQDYKELHTSPLVPLDIKINVDDFTKEIRNFPFQKWGKSHTHLSRYGLSLVNQTGLLIDEDPINGSLYEWNLNNPNFSILETDCLLPTKILDLDSLKPLRILDTHWCRSNILRWNKDAEFKPHIDTTIPSPWLRLWGTTDSTSFDLKFYNEYNEIIQIDIIEPGRIYLIDTSIVHDAICKNGTVYQFFLSVLPSAYKILSKLKC